MCQVIVVDAESIRLLVSDVMPICMIIAFDIVMTLRGSINCSTVICSPTVIFAILREASSEHYGPRAYSTPYFQSYTFSLFHFPPSDPTLQSLLKGLTTPFSVGCKLFVFVQVLWTWRDPPSGSIPWFSNSGKYLLLLCCITLSYSREKPKQAQSPSTCQILALLFEK